MNARTTVFYSVILMFGSLHQSAIAGAVAVAEPASPTANGEITSRQAALAFGDAKIDVLKVSTEESKSTVGGSHFEVKKVGNKTYVIPLPH